MSERLQLKSEVRTAVGTRHSEALRKQGLLPAVIYGHGKDPVAVSMNYHDFVEGLHHGHRLLDLEIDGKPQTLLVKDLQYDAFGVKVIHADLVRVDLTERVTVEVAIELKGTAVGTEQGAIVDQMLAALEIECLVSDIPDSIPVSVKALDVGDTIHAKDITLEGDMKIVTDPEALVALCHIVAAQAEEEEEEGAEGEEEEMTSPEVITERKSEEESESE